LSTLRNWSFFVHQRARDYFDSEEALDMVLAKIAGNVCVDSDPLLGSRDSCVLWLGPKKNREAVDERMGEGTGAQDAIMHVTKPEEGESEVFVNRVMAFIFASEGSFQNLMRHPKEPFKMSCGNQLCINVAHIQPAVELNECNRTPALVTLHPLSTNRGYITLSCTSVGGNEIAQIEVDASSTTLADVRANVAKRLSLPSQAVALLANSSEVLPKASDESFVADLPL
jgi:hypothetical protein